MLIHTFTSEINDYYDYFPGDCLRATESETLIKYRSREAIQAEDSLDKGGNDDSRRRSDEKRVQHRARGQTHISREG